MLVFTCSRPPTWTARARVRMTTRLSSSESPYRVEVDFWPAPCGWFLGGAISELPKPVMSLRALVSTVSCSCAWLLRKVCADSWCRCVSRLSR